MEQEVNTGSAAGNTCRLCGRSSRETGVELNFRAHNLLPHLIAMRYCQSCDFLYAAPCIAENYHKYYESHTNDQVGLHDSLSALDVRRYGAQAELLRPYLAGRSGLHVLDFGCGRAGLLSTLRGMFTENKYFGLDPNVKNTRSGNLTLMSNMTGIDCQFDLIIVSHTLEHLVDFEIMDKLRAMLKPSGLFFVEVPDASRYDRYDRKEFMYQLDRLHVNHFSLASLEKLLEKRGLKRVSSGSNDFEYKDGELYPAIYMVAEVNSGEIEWPRIQSELGLDAHLRRYYLSEVAKAKKVQNRIGNGPIVIYGFGDNFFRSSGHNGPLERADIVAVVDKNHAVLKASSYASQYTFLSIEESLPLAGKHPFVITVSWGALTIEKQLKEMGVVDTILI